MCAMAVVVFFLKTDSPSPSYLSYQKLDPSHKMSNFSFYNQNSAVVVIIMPGFFHSSTQRCCRQGCPRRHKICVSRWFTASSADLCHFLCPSKWILSIWELTTSKGQMQKIDQTTWGKCELCKYPYTASSNALSKSITSLLLQF